MEIDGTVLVADVDDYDVIDPVEKGDYLGPVEKGDYLGHPFRGNQWTDGSGASRDGAGGAGRADPEMERQAFNMRQQGRTWEQIARALGYANGGSVRRLAMRHEARTGGTPKPAVVTPTKTVDVKAGTEVAAARKLLDDAVGDDLWQALREANSDRNYSLGNPISKAEKSIVNTVTEAGHLLNVAIAAEYAKMRYGLSPAERQEVVMDVLSQYGVEFGSKANVRVRVTNGTAHQQRAITEDISDALAVLPTKLIAGTPEITGRSNPSPANFMNPLLHPPTPLSQIEVAQSDVRAHIQNLQNGRFQFRLNGGKPSDPLQTRNYNKSTALHEVMHGIEYVNPIIRQMESVYWNQRAGKEKLKSLNTIMGTRGYSPSEKGVKDTWLEGYAGKNYGAGHNVGRGQTYEIMSTGIESLMYGGRPIDDSHRAFVLGVLAASAHIKTGDGT